MTILAAIISLLLFPVTLAQAPPPSQSPPATTTPAPAPTQDDGVLNSGPCLDSPGSVPRVLQAPLVREMQVIRIDKVISTYTLTQGEVIGFVYFTHDGTEWLGQRTPDYMSASDARQINHVLASTRLSPSEPSQFPPTMRFGVPVRSQQYFRVQIPESANGPLHIRIEPCIAWPPGRRLPDPSW